MARTIFLDLEERCSTVNNLCTVYVAFLNVAFLNVAFRFYFAVSLWRRLLMVGSRDVIQEGLGVLFRLEFGSIF